MISKTEIAQLVAKTFVASKVARVTAKQIASHTNLNEDDTSVEIAGHVVGYVVCCETQPYTDDAVVKVAEWIKAKKEARNNK